ncbi:MAG: hypothetical protein IPK82_16740 [Polyangiaceae bacterium]|nr:hypothetical protein [Polyangiaceae bacterium]
MQNELDSAGLPMEVKILGVNAIGLESGNASVTMNRDLPWLQDVQEQNVWVSWNVVWRDVWVLDADNVPVAVYNLTEHNLADPLQYAEFKTILTNVANGNPP